MALVAIHLPCADHVKDENVNNFTLSHFCVHSPIINQSNRGLPFLPMWNKRCGLPINFLNDEGGQFCSEVIGGVFTRGKLTDLRTAGRRRQGIRTAGQSDTSTRLKSIIQL
jgi:hypothetical protein